MVRGAYQLLPAELLKMRTVLVSSNLLEDLQLWTIILVSVCTFLRHDEYHDMKLTDIIWDLCIFKDGVVVALTIAVCGKTDKVIQHLTIGEWMMFRNFVQ